MRGGGFLILSLLVVIAIILFLYAGGGDKSYLKTVSDANKKAKVEANAFSGQDSDGQSVSLSATYGEPEADFNYLLVKTVKPGGALATTYGLQAGDRIVEIGQFEVGGYLIGDVETAQNYLDDAFARKMSLTVRREGEKITLEPKN